MSFPACFVRLLHCLLVCLTTFNTRLLYQLDNPRFTRDSQERGAPVYSAVRVPSIFFLSSRLSTQLRLEVPKDHQGTMVPRASLDNRDTMVPRVLLDHKETMVPRLLLDYRDIMVPRALLDHQGRMVLKAFPDN